MNYSENTERTQEIRSGFSQQTKNKELYEEYFKMMPEFEANSESTANEFDYDLEWYNSEPLYFETNLKNKLVLIDFWTSCCCDCLHLLPVLEKLEKKFEGQNGVAFIGVHSGKFEAESDSYHLKKNILKYDVKHPVLNDASMQIWGEYECSFWPTVFIIAPNRQIIKVYKETVPHKDLEIFLEAAYDYYYPSLNQDPLPIKLESQKEKDEKLNLQAEGNFFSFEKEMAIKSNLRFPQKIQYVTKEECVLYGCNLLLISDMGNHRVLLINEDTYQCLETIGTGFSGYKDGSFEKAQFNQTCGAAYLNNCIYICDAKNHMIRCANLETKSVSTVAGTGERGENPLASIMDMRKQSLSSPVDIEYDRDSNCFYVAMSGIHQIWKLDTVNKTMLPMSGDGVEACHDDTDDLMKCQWAQPYGICVGMGRDDKRELFVADSESSSIRSVNLTDMDSSRTIVGGDGTSTNLFWYGDKDGEGTNARLQHPMGVHYIDPIQKVVVLDSYNHKVKLLDPKTNKISTLYGSGSGWFNDGEGQNAQFMEPTDVWYKYDSATDELWLYIADCSNDAIRKVLIQRNQMTIKDSRVQTVGLKHVPSVVEPVKSDMVECGEGGWKWIRKSKKKNKTKKVDQSSLPEPSLVTA